MSRPQGWSRLRNSRLLHVGVGRHQAENAPFPPLAEILAAQPCEGMAEKVSMVPFTCSVFQGADDSRHTLHANGTPMSFTNLLRECRYIVPVGGMFFRVEQCTSMTRSLWCLNRRLIRCYW